MKLQIKNSGILLMAALGGAVLAYTFFMFLPAHRALRETRSEIQSRQLSIMESTQTIAEVARLERHLAETRGYVERQRDALPSVDDLSLASGELTACAGQAGVRIVRFSPEINEADMLLPRATVAMTVEGKVEQIFDFAARIEALRGPIWCQTFSFQANDAQPDDVEAEFDLLIFAANIEKSG